ncbi:unnamed protein product [Ectocarpus sp. 12 AP-2014]
MQTALALQLVHHLAATLTLLAFIPARGYTPPAASMALNGGGLLASFSFTRRRPSVVGLIGGIASGKSTVSKALGTACGLEVIDADKLGHESYQPGTRCFGKLVDAFGENIVAGDGTIDRRALGQAVFGNPSNMARLQGIVWPEIRLLAEARIEGLGKEGAESVVLEAAVLLEAGWDDLCDELWVVQAPPAVARARLMKRNGFEEAEADKRIASQPMTNQERAARATVVLSNEGTEEDLVAKAETWISRSGILRRQRRRRRSLAFLGVAAVAGAAVVAVASVLLKRGRALR